VRRVLIAAGILLASAFCAAQSTAVFASIYAEHVGTLTTDPKNQFWRDAQPIYAEVDGDGHALPEYRTEVRSRWTKTDIYFLFVCPYNQLYLKPKPDAEHETYELWNWNVAEAFIGTDFKDIHRYKEFEVSPRNEWIDLDIDLHKPHHENGWVWNSGFEHQARIDEQKHVWYAVLRVPFSAVDSRPPATGNTFRVNFYRTDGSGKDAKEVMWQAVMTQTFHTPERFGMIELRTK
jgi:hypothetical protein